MPVRELNRQQTWLLPPTLDELIPDDHPARFVATIVDSLGWSMWEKLGIRLDGEPLGAPAYHPRALLGIWLYGFMTGTRSSRKLETACRDQMPYLWLTGWQHPDHNTLWRFYKEHRTEMRHLFKLTVRTAVNMDLVDLAIQAVDGTKIQANAARERTYDERGLRQLLKRTDRVIHELEKQNEAGDDPPPVHLPEKLRQAQLLRTEVKAAMERLAEEEGLKRVNLTDGDAKLMKSRQGIVAGYNLEAVVSPLKVTDNKKTGMIMTGVEAVQEPEDHNQLIPMLEQSEETTGNLIDMTMADAGYHSGANLAVCEQRKQMIAMPESQEHRLKNPYHKDSFSYDANTDSYICPIGQTLKFIEARCILKKVVRVYGGLGTVCRQCSAFGICTKNRYRGRELLIGPYDAELRRHRLWMATDEAKTIYKRRKGLVEPAFGIIKEQIGVRRFLLRGWSNVQAEANTMATAFNLRTLWSVWISWSSEKRGLLAITIQELGHKISHALPILHSYPNQVLSQG
ncbi:IS1182 family transposase [Chloroflexota bacterium]